MPNKEEIKQKYLLSSSINPLGRYVNSKKLSEKVYDSYEDYYYDCLSDVEFDPGDVLSEKDYQEIYRIIIDDIKQHANEWKIESEGTSKVIKHDSGKKHYKEGLEEEEWKEIEQILKQRTQENNKNMTNWKESGSPFLKKDTFSGFTEEITQEWINSGFTKKETREWLESGLQQADAKFAWWLKDIKKIFLSYTTNATKTHYEITI